MGMDQLFKRLDMHESEQKVYKLLLSQQALTASVIAKKSEETRTNTYSILEQLVDKGLVSIEESQPVRRYLANDPRELTGIIEQKKQQLEQTQAMAQAAMPELLSLFNLAHHKPGVFHSEGVEGYKKLLEDMAKAKSDIWLLPSQSKPKNREAAQVLKLGIAKRRAKGVKTKVLWPIAAKGWGVSEDTEAQNYENRFWGEPVDAEVIQYDDKVAFTVYEPELINTIITDRVLASTMATLFHAIWETAETNTPHGKSEA